MRRFLVLALSLVAATGPVRAAIVEGRVVEAGTNTPIVGATVSLVAPGFFIIPHVVAHAQTDAEGRYSVDTGTYADPVAAVAVAPGFAARTHAGEPCHEPIFCYHTATKITLSNTEPLTVGFVLGRGARLRGTALDRDDGRPPAAGAYVQILHVGVPGREHLTAATTVAADGSFEFTDIHGGNYALSVSASIAPTGTRRYLKYIWPQQYCDDVQVDCAALTPQPLTLSDGATLDAIDIPLRAGAHVRVRMISDGNGDWIEHYSAVSAASDPTRRINAYTEADGFTVTGPLLPGPVKLDVHPYAAPAYPAIVYPDLPCSDNPCDLAGAPTIDVADGAMLTLDDVHVLPLRTASGRITDRATGLPISGARVSAGQLQSPIFGQWGFAPDKTTSSGADGRYTLEGFAGDEVVIATRQAEAGWIDRAWQDVECGGANRFCNAQATAYTAPDFALQPHPGDLDLALERGATLSGRVVYAGSGVPAANYAVAVAPAASQLLGKPVRTDAEGRFTLGGLTAESYYLYASPQPAFANTAGTLWPDLPCSLSFIDSPIDCTPTPSQQLTPLPGGTIGDLILVVPDTETVFIDGFEG